MMLLAVGIAGTAFESRSNLTRGIPRGYPAFTVPADNPMSQAKVDLGRMLFYDRRLSFNGAIACASCHRQEFAFADPRPQSVGATGELTPRNAMTLTNVAFNARYTWANSTLETLEQQTVIPLTHEGPLEMGVSENEAGILDRFRNEPRYVELFAAAFPDEGGTITLEHVVKAISTFERLLISFNTPYDRFLAGSRSALSESAKRGMNLFRSDSTKCGRCHDGVTFRETTWHRVSEADTSVAYHNIGLYNLQHNGAYPFEDPGLIAVTGAADDMGRFKPPTLRNIAVTAPYFHDGSASTLEEVIDTFAAGGRVIASGPNAGDGRVNPHKSPLITGFTITPDEKRDLIAFLESLTDRAFLTNPALASPFPATR